jgi:hypothetical protein
MTLLKNHSPSSLFCCLFEDCSQFTFHPNGDDDDDELLVIPGTPSPSKCRRISTHERSYGETDQRILTTSRYW